MTDLNGIEVLKQLDNRDDRYSTSSSFRDCPSCSELHS